MGLSHQQAIFLLLETSIEALKDVPITVLQQCCWRLALAADSTLDNESECIKLKDPTRNCNNEPEHGSESDDGGRGRPGTVPLEPDSESDNGNRGRPGTGQLETDSEGDNGDHGDHGSPGTGQLETDSEGDNGDHGSPGTGQLVPGSESVNGDRGSLIIHTNDNCGCCTSTIETTDDTVNTADFQRASIARNLEQSPGVFECRDPNQRLHHNSSTVDLVYAIEEHLKERARQLLSWDIATVVKNALKDDKEPVLRHVKLTRNPDLAEQLVHIFGCLYMHDECETYLVSTKGASRRGRGKRGWARRKGRNRQHYEEGARYGSTAAAILSGPCAGFIFLMAPYPSLWHKVKPDHVKHNFENLCKTNKGLYWIIQYLSVKATACYLMYRDQVSRPDTIASWMPKGDRMRTPRNSQHQARAEDRYRSTFEMSCDPGMYGQAVQSDDLFNPWHELLGENMPNMDWTNTPANPWRQLLNGNAKYQVNESNVTGEDSAISTTLDHHLTFPAATQQRDNPWHELLTVNNQYQANESNATWESLALSTTPNHQLLILPATTHPWTYEVDKMDWTHPLSDRSQARLRETSQEHCSPHVLASGYEQVGNDDLCGYQMGWQGMPVMA